MAVSDGGRLAGVLMPGVAVDDPRAQVRDLMVAWTPRLTFPASQPVSRALERLAVLRASLLVLVDDGGGVVGVLDSDGVRSRLEAEGVDGRRVAGRTHPTGAR